MKKIVALVLTLGLATAADASYLLEIDTDGMDDGVLTFNANFSFGGDTTSASESAASSAVGLSGGDSIYGGNGSASPDTYLYTYTPIDDGDNLTLGAGTPLNSSGDVDSGLVAGGSGDYEIYATWPLTSNVSGGDTTFTLSDGMGDVFSVVIDQNAGGAGSGDEWIKLGTGTLDASTPYVLAQEAGNNTFVSMRAAAVLFMPVPEPTGLALLALGSMAILRRRR